MKAPLTGAAHATVRRMAAKLARGLGAPAPSNADLCPHRCPLNHRMGDCLCGYRKLPRPA